MAIVVGFGFLGIALWVRWDRWTQASDKGWMLMVLLLAFGLRLLLATGHYAWVTSKDIGSDYFGDARAYASSGHYIAEVIRGERLTNVDNNDPYALESLRRNYQGKLPPYGLSRLGLYAWYVGLVYTLLGPAPLVIKFINVFFGTMIGWSVYHITRLLVQEALAPRLALLLVSLFPTGLLWSTSGMKEALVVFCITSGILLWIVQGSKDRWAANALGLGMASLGPWVGLAVVPYVLFRVRSSVRIAELLKPVAFCFVFALLVELRFVAAWVLVTASVGAGIFSLPSWAWKRGVLVGGGLLLIFPLALSTTVRKEAYSMWQEEYRKVSYQVIRGNLGGWVSTCEGPRVSYKCLSRTRYKILPERYYEMDEQELGRRLMHKVLEPLTPVELIQAYLRGLGYVLFAPFPWMINSTKDILAVGTQMFLIGLLPFFVWGCKQAWRLGRPGFSFWSIYLVIMVSLLATKEGNIGTLFRHREMVIPLLLVAAGAGMAAWLEARRQTDSAPELLPAPGSLLYKSGKE